MKSGNVSRAEFMFLLWFFLISAYFYTLTFNYSQMSRFFPVIILNVTLFLLLVKFIGYKYQLLGKYLDPEESVLQLSQKMSEGKKQYTDLESRSIARSPAMVILGLILYLLLIYLVGFLIAVPVYLLINYLLVARINWFKSIIIILGVYTFIYLFFVVLLKIRF